MLVSNLVRLLLNQGKLAEAEPLYREAVEANRETLGDRHKETLISIGNLVRLFLEQGKLTEAAPLYREAVEANRETLPDRHPHGTLTRSFRSATWSICFARRASWKRRRLLWVMRWQLLPRCWSSGSYLKLGLHSFGTHNLVEQLNKEALRVAVEQMAEALGAEHYQTGKYNAVLKVL